MHTKVIFWLGFLYAIFAAASLADALLIPNNLPSSVPNSTDKQCRIDSQLFLNELRKDTRWAHMLHGASARDMRNFLKGSIYFLGDIQDCFNRDIPFKTRYCLTDIFVDVSSVSNCSNVTCNDIYDDLRPNQLYMKLPRNPIHWAVCSPASCSIVELQNAMQEALDAQNSSAKFRINIACKNCQIPPNASYNLRQWCFVLLISSLIALVIASTYFKEHLNESLVYCFSASKSWNELTKEETSGEALRVLNAFKVMFAFHLVMGHVYCLSLTGPIANQNDVEKANRYFGHTISFKQETIVECYLGLGGLLTAYSFSKRCTNPLRNTVRRYFRLAPLMAVTILYYVSFFDHGYGPLWRPLVAWESDNCRKNWWLNLLFINNYVDVKHMCILQTWYLPADMHSYIVTMACFLLWHRNRKWGYTAIASCFAFCTIYNFWEVFFNGVAPFFVFYNNLILLVRTEEESSFMHLYVPSHTRGNVYYAGVFIGIFYYYMKEHHKDFKLTTRQTIFGYVIGILIGHWGINPLLADPSILSVEGPYNIWHAIYAALHRPVAAVGIFTVAFTVGYAPCSGLRGWLNRPILTILSRLTFGVYMFHMAIQTRAVASWRQPLYYTTSFWYESTIVVTIISYLFAFAMFFLVESPCARIFEKLWPNPQPSGKDIISVANNVKKDN